MVYTQYENIEDDPYALPNGCLINTFGISNTKDLNDAEARLVRIKLAMLQENPILGDFSLAHAQAIHRFLFTDVYPWAGNVRTVDMMKGDTYFCHHRDINRVFQSMHQQLIQENTLGNLPKAILAERLAYYFAQLNIIHPFREGNGRMQREFIGLLAKQNHVEIQWGSISPEYMKTSGSAGLARQLLVTIRMT